jgi:hypothetical protein
MARRGFAWLPSVGGEPTDCVPRTKGGSARWALASTGTVRAALAGRVAKQTTKSLRILVREPPLPLRHS